MNTNQIQLEIIILDNQQNVWEKFKQFNWWQDFEIDLRVGGKFEETWWEEGVKKITLGTVSELVEPQKLVLKWKDEEWGDFTDLEIAFFPVTDDTTQVKLTHSGWEKLGINDIENVIQNHILGWKYHLSELKNYCES